MLAFIKVVCASAANIIVKQYQLSLQCVLKVLFLHQRIRTQQYLVVIARQVRTLIEVIAHDELDGFWLQNEIIWYQRVLHG